MCSWSYLEFAVACPSYAPRPQCEPFPGEGAFPTVPILRRTTARATSRGKGSMVCDAGLLLRATTHFTQHKAIGQARLHAHAYLKICSPRPSPIASALTNRVANSGLEQLRITGSLFFFFPLSFKLVTYKQQVHVSPHICLTYLPLLFWLKLSSQDPPSTPSSIWPSTCFISSPHFFPQ